MSQIDFVVSLFEKKNEMIKEMPASFIESNESSRLQIDLLFRPKNYCFLITYFYFCFNYNTTSLNVCSDYRVDFEHLLY